MWSSDRRTLLAGLAAAGFVAGCGFTPVYAPGGPGTRLQGQILADAPDKPVEFVFVSRLEDRLGRNDAAPYRLAYHIETSTQGLAITSDQETLRYHLSGRVSFSVKESGTDTILTRGVVENFTSYSAIGTTVATRASQKDAAERLMIILADQVVTRLHASAESWLP